MLESIYHLNNWFHTFIGSIALIGGIVALSVTKGSERHRQAGKIFAWMIIVSAVTSLYPTIYKFREIGPVAIIMAIATIYLVKTALIAVRHQDGDSPRYEKYLPIVPALLMVLPVIRIGMALSSGDYNIFWAPVCLATLFSYLLITDIQILRDRNRSKTYWLRRHLERMIFAFAFGVMALVRIGVNFGLSFEMSIILPLIAAVILIAYMYRRELGGAA